MNPWKWTPERTQGIWKYGPAWLKPAAAAVPWITVGLLLLMLHMVGGSLTAAEGVLFDLPDSGAADFANTSLVALVMPMPRETLVFFDDARYSVGDDLSFSAFGDHLADRAGKSERRTLLVLADRRVAGGDLMKIASIARRSGIEKVLFAEKKTGGLSE